MRKTRSENGFFTIWALGLCLILFAVGGISLDLWRGFSDRRQLAAISDAAAIAAASQIDLQAFQQEDSILQLDVAAAEQRARDFVLNEVDEENIDLRGLQVQADEEAIQITATSSLQLTLLQVLQPGRDITIQVTSAAEPRLGQ